MVVTELNDNIVKFEAQIERQTPLKLYSNSRGPRSSEQIVEKKIQSHVTEFTRKIRVKGKSNKKHEPRSGVSSSKSNIARALRVQFPE